MTHTITNHYGTTNSYEHWGPVPLPEALTAHSGPLSVPLSAVVWVLAFLSGGLY